MYYIWTQRRVALSCRRLWTGLWFTGVFGVSCYPFTDHRVPHWVQRSPVTSTDEVRDGILRYFRDSVSPQVSPTATISVSNTKSWRAYHFIHLCNSADFWFYNSWQRESSVKIQHACGFGRRQHPDLMMKSESGLFSSVFHLGFSINGVTYIKHYSKNSKSKTVCV